MSSNDRSAREFQEPETNAETSIGSEGLVCVRCQYDLTGLHRDPRRCPECGRDNYSEELNVSKIALINELRELESLPTYGIGGIWITGIGILLFLNVWKLVGLAFGIIGVLICILTTVQFGRVCDFRKGWLSAQVWLYSAGLTIMSLLIAFCYVIASLQGNLTKIGRFVFLTSLILLIIILRLVKHYWANFKVRGPYQIAKKHFDSFCRETAVLKLVGKKEKNRG